MFQVYHPGTGLGQRDLMSQIREEVSFTKGPVIVRGQLPDAPKS